MPVQTTRQRTASAVGNILNHYEKAVIAFDRMGEIPMRDRPAVRAKYEEARRRLTEYLKSAPIP